ncbi:MAG: nuclear transport factor 2 family protein [Acidimicrobiia bacterium]|nr:nuclear transport factor 2 family protein [Acidimicrobiia bacterium]
MTDHPNLEAARTGYEAFANGDMATVSDLLADDIVWHAGGDNILTGVYEGKEAVFNYFGRLMQETGGSFKNDIHDMLANDDHGVALVTVHASRAGKSIEARVVHVFHMRDGKMVEFWASAEDQSLFDEFWA